MQKAIKSGSAPLTFGFQLISPRPKLDTGDVFLHGNWRRNVYMDNWDTGDVMNTWTPYIYF